MKKRFDSLKFPKLGYVRLKKKNTGAGDYWVALWGEGENRVLATGGVPFTANTPSDLKKILELNYDQII